MPRQSPAAMSTVTPHCKSHDKRHGMACRGIVRGNPRATARVTPMSKARYSPGTLFPSVGPSQVPPANVGIKDEPATLFPLGLAAGVDAGRSILHEISSILFYKKNSTSAKSRDLVHTASAKVGFGANSLHALHLPLLVAYTLKLTPRRLLKGLRGSCVRHVGSGGSLEKARQRFSNFTYTFVFSAAGEPILFTLGKRSSIVFRI